MMKKNVVYWLLGLLFAACIGVVVMVVVEQKALLAYQQAHRN